MLFNILVPALALAPLVAGHGAVTSYIIGGITYPGYEGFSPATSPKTIQFQWPDYNPVMNVNDIKMRCNGGTSADLSAPVNAGENVTAVWKQWTHEQGPVMVWLYKCPGDFSSCKGDGKGWFKIDQLGLYGTQLTSNEWGTGIVYRDLRWTSRIPRNLAPGNYLIRHELLALHQANSPQFYPECAQIVVSGSGNALPPAERLYSIPTYAPQNDPGIMVSAFFCLCQKCGEDKTNGGRPGRHLQRWSHLVHPAGRACLGWVRVLNRAVRVRRVWRGIILVRPEWRCSGRLDVDGVCELPAAQFQSQQ